MRHVGSTRERHLVGDTKAVGQIAQVGATRALFGRSTDGMAFRGEFPIRRREREREQP